MPATRPLQLLSGKLGGLSRPPTWAETPPTQCQHSAAPASGNWNRQAHVLPPSRERVFLEAQPDQCPLGDRARVWPWLPSMRLKDVGEMFEALSPHSLTSSTLSPLALGIPGL